MNARNFAATGALLALTFSFTPYAQENETTDTVSAEESAANRFSFSQGNTDKLARQFIEFGYNDAEAGFNGLYLAGLYSYNEDYQLISEASLLRGHSVNYKHIFAGVQRNFATLKDLPVSLVPAVRGGLLYSSLQDDSEYGVLLGGRLKSPILSRLIVETGLDWHSAGENSLLLAFRVTYDLTDTLYLHSSYWTGDIHEMALGIGTTF